MVKNGVLGHILLFLTKGVKMISIINHATNSKDSSNRISTPYSCVSGVGWVKRSEPIKAIPIGPEHSTRFVGCALRLGQMSNFAIFRDFLPHFNG